MTMVLTIVVLLMSTKIQGFTNTNTHQHTTPEVKSESNNRFISGKGKIPRKQSHIFLRSWRTRLASTTAKGGNSPNTEQDRNYNVLFQKVLRAPKSSSSFLLDLVSYLQCVHKIPNDLPMPYEITIPDDDEYDDHSEYSPSQNRAVLIIDSPLSSNPYEACLEVEVIGIFPDNSNVHVGPTMAMVALKKRRDADDGSTGMTGDLFAASERRIAQSLDRGLQDFEEGRVPVPQSTRAVTSDADELMNEIDKFDGDGDDEVEEAMKRIGYKNSIDAIKVSSRERRERTVDQKDTKSERGSPIIERDSLGNIVIDPVVSSASSPTQSPVRSEEKEKAMGETGAKAISQAVQKSMPETSASKRQEDLHSGDDYAVRMARQQAKALMKRVTVGSTTSSAECTVAISGGESDFAILAAKNAAKRLKAKGQTTASVKTKPVKGEQKAVPSTKRQATKIEKGKVQDLSNDEMFVKLRNVAGKAKLSSWESTIHTKGSSTSQGSLRINKAVPRKGKAPAQAHKSEDEVRNDVMQIARENEQVQRELRAATDMMPVEKDGEEGLSPEELLKEVLKFGEETEKGDGFAEGAFAKARELLLRRDEGNLPESPGEIGFKERDRSIDGLKEISKEDELKRIFAVGQDVASSLSRTTKRPPSLAKPAITDEDINELIDSDESVPRNARVLDDELAELEVRMSRSGESGEHDIFDVFSGPEVYNRNVDPATSVNWPGAKEGTRTDVRLATDLSNALKQARFASAVLSQMREEVGETNGHEQVRYMVGSREISLERVTLLRQCVNEAVKAGIIADPELLVLERSRLQMLLDELALQPEERLEDIAMSYKDVLLSDNLIDLIKERLHAMVQRDLDARREGDEDLLKEAHSRERAILINLAQIAQALVKEAQALGAELEVSMLEIIRSICEVAMDPSHKSEEETAIALTDAVRDMRPLLDDAFVAYLKYAIDEEEGKLARAGVVDDPEHNRWLFVLKIVQEGVYAELSQGIKRYIDHIWYILRMKTKSERKQLLAKLVDAMPTMDVRPFVKVVVRCSMWFVPSLPPIWFT